MTANNATSKSSILSLTATVVDGISAGVSQDFARPALPRPVNTLASVADSGRIRFGAGFRLPTAR